VDGSVKSFVSTDDWREVRSVQGVCDK
jgi:hypothetical protein